MYVYICHIIPGLGSHCGKYIRSQTQLSCAVGYSRQIASLNIKYVYSLVSVLH